MKKEVQSDKYELPELSKAKSQQLSARSREGKQPPICNKLAILLEINTRLKLQNTTDFNKEDIKTNTEA